MAIQLFSKWRTSAILGLWNSNILTIVAVKRHILHQFSEFRQDRSNRCRDIAIVVILQYGGCRHLGFSKIRNSNSIFHALKGVNMRHLAKFCRNRSSGCGDMAISRFFQNGGRPPSWTCWWHVFGLPTMNNWWSLSLRQIWSKSMK